MTDEKKNREKRKSIPLTTSESLIFFLIPFRFLGYRIFNNNDFNKSEIERFKQHGFDLKVKQAKELIIYGYLFYIGLIITIVYFL